MGFLPIFVALAGLIVLYSLVTYNQIKPKKAALTKVIDQMTELSKNRKNAILSYDRANANSPLKEVAAELMKTSTDRFQSFRKENELISKTNEGVSTLGEGALEVKNEVNSLNQDQEKNLKRLQATADHYNSFIGKAPTKFVASLFGFRAF